jgi:hypothetical protein
VSLAAAGWIQVAGALAVELVESLLERARGQASAAALHEAGAAIARAVMRIPLSVRQHSQTTIAAALVESVARVARLDADTEQDLLNVVGAELLRATLDEVAELAEKTTRIVRDV